MTPNLNVCMFPMNIHWGKKEENIASLEETLDKIYEGTDVLILPEMFSTGFITSNKEEVRKYAEKNTGETMEILKRISMERGFAIAGSFIADTGGSLYNRAFFIEPNGDLTFADKRHLFSMASEHTIFSSGDRRLNVRYRGWNLSMVVCYDIRFPIWCRNKDCEYDLLIAVANWPKVRVDAWYQLLKARAIENLSYVCGVNCSGTDDNGYEYDGCSPAFDFKGKEIARKSPESELSYASLSYEKLENFRKKFPAWRDADKYEIKID